MSGRELKLNLFIYPGGHHETASRYPGSAPERGLDLDYDAGLACHGRSASTSASMRWSETRRCLRHEERRGHE